MAAAFGWFGILRPPVLVALVGTFLAACSTSPDSGPRFIRDDQPGELSKTRQVVVQTATQLIGTPYRYGGDNVKGFDCSGLVQYTHRKAGVPVPRTTASQLAQSRVPERRNLLPGDLLFFEIDWQKSRHVGIYEGDGVFIHAPSSGKRVSRASLNNIYWGKRLIATRSFLQQ